MKQFTYVGPHDAVEVVGLGVVERGHTVDVYDPELSRGLEDQPDNWQHKPVKSASKAAKRTPTAAARKAADPMSPVVPTKAETEPTA